jgi:hypothetical protein
MRRQWCDRVILWTLIAAAASSACGGRPQLIPAYQIGRLSANAVVASDAGVRVVVRTNVWPGPSPGPAGVIPVELTVVNRSGDALRLRRQDVALVTAAEHRIGTLAPSEVMHIEQAVVNARSLEADVVDPDERLTGFVYFPEPADAEEMSLQVDLVSAARAQRFGRIEIPFTFE